MPIKFHEHKPKSLTEAIDILYASMSDEEKTFVQDNGTVILHHSFGMAMRNNWGLWSGSDLKEFFVTTYGIEHADDMSGLIMDGLEARVKGESFEDGDIQIRVDAYKQHWIDTEAKV